MKMKLRKLLRFAYYFIIKYVIKMLERALRNKIIHVRGMRILCLPEVFPPVFTISTELFLDVLDKIIRPNMHVLEIGSGSGVISIYASRKKAFVCAVDVCKNAVIATKINAKLNKVNLNVRQSDLFENVRGKFDLIIFNPPFFPVEPKSAFERTIFSGSEYKVILQFLFHARKYLKRNGFILMCLTSAIDEGFILQFAKKFYNVSLIKQKSILIERISLYKLRPK